MKLFKRKKIRYSPCCVSTTFQDCVELVFYDVASSGNRRHALKLIPASHHPTPQMAPKSRRKLSRASSPPFVSSDGPIEDSAGQFLQPEAQLGMTPIVTPQSDDFHTTKGYFTPAKSPAKTSIKDKMADGKPLCKPKSPWPWSRRANIWDPPTMLDLILDSPLRALISFLYGFLLSLRGSPFKPPRNKPKVRVVCISDTHTPHIPNGDVLIHAGDLTNAGTVDEIQKQLDWLASLPHREKIFIAGNHDSYFDPRSRKEGDQGKRLNLRGCHYLQNKGIGLKFKGGRKLSFWGSPDIPKCGGSDFA
jgi:hypothetical protein